MCASILLAIAISNHYQDNRFWKIARLYWLGNEKWGAIAGLWNSGTGTIIRPQLEEILFLPQRPYF